MLLRHAPPGLRALTLGLLLGVLAVRILIPSGFMWSSAGSAPTLIACPSAAPSPVGHMVMSGHHDAGHHGEHGGKADHPCAFAAASAAVDLAAVLHPAPILARLIVVEAGVAFFARPGLGLAAPPPPKTGPPSFG